MYSKLRNKDTQFYSMGVLNYEALFIALLLLQIEFIVHACPKVAGASIKSARRGLEVRFLQKEIFGKASIDESTKQRHLFNFDISLKGRERFLHRPILMVTAMTVHRTFRPTFF